MAIRCKMQLEGIVPNTWGGWKALYRCQYDGNKSPEDVSFAKATPSGQAEFTIDNPEAINQLVIGEYYYFDIVPVPKPVAQAA